MKRHIVFSFLTLFLSLAASEKGNAQSSYCPTTVPDCPTSPWIAGGCIDTKIWNPVSLDSCWVRICFCYRNACGLYDYYLHSFSTDSCSANMTVQEKFVAVRERLFKANPAGFWGYFHGGASKVLMIPSLCRHMLGTVMSLLDGARRNARSTVTRMA